MALIRLWQFTPRSSNPVDGSIYPEAGTYDTIVLDEASGNCSDSHQEIHFESLLNYAAGRGEVLQQSTLDNARILCSRARITGAAPTATAVGSSPTPAPATSFGTAGQTTTPGQAGCSGGLCGPTGGTSPVTAAQVPGQTGGGAPSLSSSSSPSGGSLSGGQRSPTSGSLASLAPTSGAGTSGTTVGTAGSPTASMVSNGFDVVAFLKGPLGMLLIVLLVIMLILTRK